MKNPDLIERVDYLLEKGNNILQPESRIGCGEYYVDAGLLAGFKAASLSFIANLHGESHIYYKEFKSGMNGYTVERTNMGINILKAIKDEIEHGWLTSYKNLISAEIFSDFLEMADYLLKEGFKDAAAVIIGATLENHLRKLCVNNDIDTEIIKSNGDKVTKTASTMNADLHKAGVCDGLQQKSITAWIDIRNSAAHGHYDKYTKENVKQMYDGVLYFMSACK
jgi:hypothetical protein